MTKLPSSDKGETREEHEARMKRWGQESASAQKEGRLLQSQQMPKMISILPLLTSKLRQSKTGDVTMNIYQRIVLVVGAVAVVFVLLTAPKFASIPRGNMKLKVNTTTDNFYYETDVPKVAIREFVVVAVMVLLYFATGKISNQVIIREDEDHYMPTKLSGRCWKFVKQRWYYLVIAVFSIVIVVLLMGKPYQSVSQPAEPAGRKPIGRPVEYQPE